MAVACKHDARIPRRQSSHFCLLSSSDCASCCFTKFPLSLRTSRKGEQPAAPLLSIRRLYPLSMGDSFVNGGTSNIHPNALTLLFLTKSHRVSRSHCGVVLACSFRVHILFFSFDFLSSLRHCPGSTTAAHIQYTPSLTKGPIGSSTKILEGVLHSQAYCASFHATMFTP